MENILFFFIAEFLDSAKRISLEKQKSNTSSERNDNINDIDMDNVFINIAFFIRKGILQTEWNGSGDAPLSVPLIFAEPKS